MATRGELDPVARGEEEVDDAQVEVELHARRGDTATGFRWVKCGVITAVQQKQQTIIVFAAGAVMCGKSYACALYVCCQ